MVALSRLEEIRDLRTVWPHEALDFTPWLAREDNISLLADTLGLDISVEKIESCVGDFNVDIFASETGTDRTIIIENQLEDTDHDHLGKLITYASGKSADVIVWLVKRAREEHRAAIEWLNNHTDENIGFFLCEIKLFRIGGSVIGCKQFSCSGDAVWRLIMGCRRMLSVEDRAAIMAGVDVGLSQVRIAHLIGRSPSVVCREIARHAGPDGQYRAEEAGKAARAARRRPKKRLLDCDEILRDRVIADLSQGHTPRQISGRLSMEACGTLPSMDTSPDAQGHTISHEAIYTWIYAHPKKTLIEHGICLPSRRWVRKKPPTGGRKPPIVGMRLIDERPDISDRKIPGNWEGDLIIGQDGASACATLVERTTRYLIIVALPLGRKADQVRRAHPPHPGPARPSDAHTDMGPRP